MIGLASLAANPPGGSPTKSSRTSSFWKRRRYHPFATAHASSGPVGLARHEPAAAPRTNASEHRTRTLTSSALACIVSPPHLNSSFHPYSWDTITIIFYLIVPEEGRIQDYFRVRLYYRGVGEAHPGQDRPPYLANVARQCPRNDATPDFPLLVWEFGYMY